MNKREEVLKKFPDAKCISYQVSQYGHTETFYSVIINGHRTGWGGNAKGAWSYAHFYYRNDLNLKGIK